MLGWSLQGCLDLAEGWGLEGPSSILRKLREGSSAPIQLQVGPGGWLVTSQTLGPHMRVGAAGRALMMAGTDQSSRTHSLLSHGRLGASYNVSVPQTKSDTVVLASSGCGGDCEGQAPLPPAPTHGRQGRARGSYYYFCVWDTSPPTPPPRPRPGEASLALGGRSQHVLGCGAALVGRAVF